MTTNLLSAVITAYCSCRLCCGKANQPTASGLWPKQGQTIAASRSIPFHSAIYIPSVGWRKVEDRLAKKYDNRIDVYFSSHQAAKQFGIKTQQVVLILK